MIGAACFVAVGSGGYLFVVVDVPPSEAFVFFVGLLMPLMLQVAFGVFLLRQEE